MSDYRHGSHTTFSIHLPIGRIPKYRHKVLRGEVAERGRAIIHEEGQQVHTMVAIPPHVTLSRLIQRMKGKSSSRLLVEFPHLRKWFWGRHVWARGSFCELLSRVAGAAKSP